MFICVSICVHLWVNCMEAADTKRLFLGIEVHAPWPDYYPRGRLLDPAHRHMTLAFLGNVSYEKVQKILPEIPKPPFKVGYAGIFDKCLFLPPRRPHVVAWHADWMEPADPLFQYQKELSAWFRGHQFVIDERDFLPHVTICRAPFYPREWKKIFTPVPFICKDIHLYESMGNLHYEPRWSYPLKSPFEEIEHTADVAFIIRGESLSQLHKHAQLALAYRFPPLIPYLRPQQQIASLEECVIACNEIVTIADGEIGCPFKAVSFHGELVQTPDNTLQWEMIIDV